MHTLGELLSQLVLFVQHLKTLQEMLSVPVVLEAVSAPDEFHMLAHRQEIEGSRHFRHIAEAALCLQRFIGAAADADRALEAKEPDNTLDDGGFTGAVGSQQYGNLPGVDGKADIVIGNGISVLFRHMFNLEQFSSPISIIYRMLLKRYNILRFLSTHRTGNQYSKDGREPPFSLHIRLSEVFRRTGRETAPGLKTARRRRGRWLGRYGFRS